MYIYKSREKGSVDIRNSTYETIPYKEHLCFHIREAGGWGGKWEVNIYGKIYIYILFFLFFCLFVCFLSFCDFICFCFPCYCNYF